MAARIRRAFSSLRKSKKDSVTNGPWCEVVRGRTGASSVVMGGFLSRLRGSLLGISSIFYTASAPGLVRESLHFSRKRRERNGVHGFFLFVEEVKTPILTSQSTRRQDGAPASRVDVSRLTVMLLDYLQSRSR